MKRRCLGCGKEFDGLEFDLCPVEVGKDQVCGCLSIAIEPAIDQSGEVDLSMQIDIGIDGPDEGKE